MMERERRKRATRLNDEMSMFKNGAWTLPKEIRRRFGLDEGGQVIVRATDEGILLAPGAAFPIESYTPERLKEFAEEEQKLAANNPDFAAKMKVAERLRRRYRHALKELAK